MADLKALNPDVLVGEAPVHEAFLGGGRHRDLDLSAQPASAGQR
jgi:hypothetical protein